MDHMHDHSMHVHQERREHLDPVCGMMVEEDPNALKTEYQGKTYYFCGRGCKAAFEKNPEKYLKEGPSMRMS